MNGIVTLDLPPRMVEMDHVSIVAVAPRFSHEYAELMRVGKLARDAGYGNITITYYPFWTGPNVGRIRIDTGQSSRQRMVITAAVVAELLSLRNTPSPIPNTILLKGDLGPPTKLEILPREKAVWKDSVYGPQRRKPWQLLRTVKNFNRRGMRGR